ncbi:MAG: CvpA family protein [Thermoguttaceae bacterium]|nr:CvpA family protein [Thermoguttaceae bacterium]MBQ6615816.1 CvpA family protein [Thermoguttaceae bacterium]
MVFFILMLVILGATIAFSVRDGIWTNLIRLFNLIFSGLIATTYFETLAGTLEGFAPTYTYLLDFLSIWLVFIVVYAILRELTNRLSLVKVWFPAIIDKWGGVALSIVLGFTMLSFSVFALYTAPLQPGYWGIHKSPTITGGWAAFAKMESDGALQAGTSFGDTKDYYNRYNTRRENQAKYASAHEGKIRIHPNDADKHKRR